MAAPLNLERILSIIAIVVALGASLYSGLHGQSSLEYMTKADFNTFQVEYVKKTTSLEGTVTNGFNGVSQQLATLNFATTKDFQDYKEKSTANQFELQKGIDLLKRDLEGIQKRADTNTQKIAEIEKKIAVLEALRGTSRE